jgi:hypothetical protein
MNVGLGAAHRVEASFQFPTASIVAYLTRIGCNDIELMLDSRFIQLKDEATGVTAILATPPHKIDFVLPTTPTEREATALPLPIWYIVSVSALFYV